MYIDRYRYRYIYVHANICIYICIYIYIISFYYYYFASRNIRHKERTTYNLCTTNRITVAAKNRHTI